MDGQVLAAVIGGVGTLVGVAAGAAGTYVAARAQVSGARTQADAMLEQAQATYRAALDQAHSAERAAHEQWQRTQRREAYAGFLSAMDKVVEVCSEPTLATAEHMAQATRILGSACAMVELEGSEHLGRLAAEAVEHCTELARLTNWLAPQASARRRLQVEIAEASRTEGVDPESRAGQALTAHLALIRLREAVYQYDQGRSDHTEYEAARVRAEAAVEGSGLFTHEQAGALLADPTWANALRASTAHSQVIERVTRARTEFVATARGELELRMT
ncbi:hypothetical protein [Streptomyces sp. NPDC056244]|uniref:hypothetical protein n=1 Tax=Streptomyces sp. NPDC056244 TaxID=3345762 RepID=UPI0035DCFDA0